MRIHFVMPNLSTSCSLKNSWHHCFFTPVPPTTWKPSPTFITRIKSLFSITSSLLLPGDTPKFLISIAQEQIEHPSLPASKLTHTWGPNPAHPASLLHSPHCRQLVRIQWACCPAVQSFIRSPNISISTFPSPGGPLQSLLLLLIVQVRDWYLESFRDLRLFPEIKDRVDELEFTQMIKMIKVRHNNVVPAMALGVQQLKKDLNPTVVLKDLHEIYQFLDRFYMSRIGIRMLIGQHVALHDPDPEPGCVGQINTRISPMQIAQTASEDARSLCFREYGDAPEVDIYGDPKFTFPYVPSHLHLMVFELVKNSLRAVQERFMTSDKDVPPVRIIVADGIEDVTIKISDEGGGIARSGLSKIFTYLYSTAKNPVDENHEGLSEGVIMAGYGYGLPISRLYARYFGGDLQMISMEGYGTDAYLHLSRLGDSQEPLP